MTPPKTIPAFRKWLVAEIAEIDRHLAWEDDPQSYVGEEQSRDAASAVRKAGSIALRLGMPELYQRPTALLSFGQAKKILSGFLATIAAKRKSGVDPRFLNVDEAARHTGISVESVRRMLDSGKLTPLRPVKGRIVIDRGQLDSVVLNSDARPRTGRGLN
jgi:hypothetical protein